MNPLDNQLHRLFNAARQVRTASAAVSVPYGMETRVMAEWRGAGSLTIWNTGLLVRGLLLASLIMGISLWPVLSKTSSSNPYSEYLQLADSTLQDSSP